MKPTLIVILALMLAACQSSEPTAEVNLYSARQEALIQPLLQAFTNETGIKVNVISSKADALLTRIQSEAANSPADVLLTTDAGRLHRAKLAGVFAPLQSSVLTDSIPARYRDPDNQWFGLSLRARVIMLNDPQLAQSISSMEDLVAPEWAEQICIRSSGNIYNQSMVAALIEQIGRQATAEWAQGLVANLARSPQGGDRDQIRAAAAGQCSIAVANTYYLAQMLASDKQSDDHQAASKMTVVWPNQTDRGAHLNVSGAGVLKHAPNPDNARKLIEFLASAKAQEIYADVNYEYPITDDLDLNPILAGFGKFKAEQISLSKLGENNAEAVKLMDQVGWK